MAAAIALIDATGIRSGTSRHAAAVGRAGRGDAAEIQCRDQRPFDHADVQGEGRQTGRQGRPRARGWSPPSRLLQRLPGRRLFLYRDADQVRTIRVRDVNAFLCDVASCNVSLQGFSDAARVLERGGNAVADRARGKPDAAQAPSEGGHPGRRRRSRQHRHDLPQELCSRGGHRRLRKRHARRRGKCRTGGRRQRGKSWPRSSARRRRGNASATISSSFANP